MTFEKKNEKLLPFRHFLKRLFANIFIAILIVLGSLFAGMLGYHFFEGMPWIDAFVNASMILSGMGPVGGLNTFSGKFFAGIYALFSGIIFLIVIAIIMAPIFHRFLHQFHVDEEGDK